MDWPAISVSLDHITQEICARARQAWCVRAEQEVWELWRVRDTLLCIIFTVWLNFLCKITWLTLEVCLQSV